MLNGDFKIDLFRLLEIERDTMEEIWPPEIHKWNIVDKNRLIYEPGCRDTKVVFPLHPQINLSERPEGSELPINRNLYFEFSDFESSGAN